VGGWGRGWGEGAAPSPAPSRASGAAGPHRKMRRTETDARCGSHGSARTEASSEPTYTVPSKPMAGPLATPPPVGYDQLQARHHNTRAGTRGHHVTQAPPHTRRAHTSAARAAHTAARAAAGATRSGPVLQGNAGARALHVGKARVPAVECLHAPHGGRRRHQGPGTARHRHNRHRKGQHGGLG
jgi:hypothetical protein